MPNSLLRCLVSALVVVALAVLLPPSAQAEKINYSFDYCAWSSEEYDTIPWGTYQIYAVSRTKDNNDNCRYLDADVRNVEGVTKYCSSTDWENRECWLKTDIGVDVGKGAASSWETDRWQYGTWHH